MGIDLHAADGVMNAPGAVAGAAFGMRGMAAAMSLRPVVLRVVAMLRVVVVLCVVVMMLRGMVPGFGIRSRIGHRVMILFAVAGHGPPRV